MQFGNRRGQTLLFFSLSVIMIFGLMSLTVEMGWSYYRKQAAQTAATAAATAAVSAALESAGGWIYCGSFNVVCQSETACPTVAPATPVTNVEKGCLYASANGFAPSNTRKITIASGTSKPPTGNGATPKYWVTVRVVESHSALFSAVLRRTGATVAARATAGYFPSALGGCIYVLNRTDQAMVMNGNINMQTGCGVNINSEYYAALKLVGSATLTASSDAKINIVGGWTQEQNTTLTPLPTTGIAHFGDPMGDVPPPDVGSCTSVGVSIGNNQKLTINPGVYCGALNVTGHAVLTLNPGLYIVTTGGVSVGGQATLNGSGVTIYVKTGSVGLAGGATTNLTAPSSGTWEGVLFYQDRANLNAASLVGGSNQSLNGILYFPATHMDYTGGNSTTAQSTTIVCDNLNIVGNSYIAASGNSPFMTLFSGIGVLE